MTDLEGHKQKIFRHRETGEVIKIAKVPANAAYLEVAFTNGAFGGEIPENPWGHGSEVYFLDYGLGCLYAAKLELDLSDYEEVKE